MADLRLGVWQRALLGLASLICLVGAFVKLGDHDDPLVAFLWGVFFAFLAAAPKDAKTEKPE